MQENNPLPEDLRVMEYLKLRAELKEVDPKKISARLDALWTFAICSEQQEGKS